MPNDRSLEILDFIMRFKRDRGLPPTIREIGKEFGIASTNGVRYHLHRLEKMGKIRRHEKISRGIESATQSIKGIPILGRVAAGQPILAEESYEGRLDAEDLFGDSRELFALRVRGDSMIDAGIFENDYVVVRHQETAHSGEMIVAMIEDEATVKFYRPGADRIELVAANPKYRPIVVPQGEEFRIIGIVRGVVRTLAH